MPWFVIIAMSLAAAFVSPAAAQDPPKGRPTQEQLASERAGLIARNEQARMRVEAMISRLKSLEQNEA